MTSQALPINFTQPEPALKKPPNPVARVAVDISLPHLDRFFDYEIPQKILDIAKPGVRVRVRFSGRLTDGFIVSLPEEVDSTIHLRPLERVISAEQVFTCAQIKLVRAVADHYGGVFADVMRLAVPSRHGATEKAEQRIWPSPNLDVHVNDGLRHFDIGERFLDGLAKAQPLRAHWLVPPVFLRANNRFDDWITGFIQSAIATLKSGRSVLVILPDTKTVVRFRDRLGDVIGLGSIAELHSDLGSAARYRNYLAVLRNQAQIVIGTRNACYAPLPNLGLICLWDDGNDLFSEIQAPYPHARDVVALRASQESCALLFASHNRTAEIQQWIEREWLIPIEKTPQQMRRLVSLARAAGDSNFELAKQPASQKSRIPKLAFDTIRNGLNSGPVLVQVARAGYLPSLLCNNCFSQIRCPFCNGPVQMVKGSDGINQMCCRWCARTINDWRCTNCGSKTIRASAVGSGRTSEELGRAFPGFRVISSAGEKIVDEVGHQPSLVIATPGAEPIAEFGYSALVLLDGFQMLTRADLRTSEETVRRWLNAISLVRPAEDGGTVCIVAPPDERSVQAIIRTDPANFARLELAERRQAGFPPAAKMISVVGEETALSSFQQVIELPEQTKILGPAPYSPATAVNEEFFRILLQSDASSAKQLVKAAKNASSARSARKLPPVRLQTDPIKI